MLQIRQIAAPVPVLILLLAAQTVGIQQAYQGAIESLTPLILALSGVALAVPAGVAIQKARPSMSWQLAALALAFLVAAGFGVIAWHSSIHLISFNLWLLMLRPLVLMLLVVAALRAEGIPYLNRGLFYCTGALAAPMVCLYLLQPLGLADELLRAGITTLDVGGITRLQGFAADPNFFGLWLVFGLFAGMGAYHSTANKRLALFFLAAIAACLVCTLSRGALLAAAAGLLVLLPSCISISRSTITKGAAVAGLLGLVTLIPLLGQGNPLQMAAQRLTRPNADRISLWKTLADDISLAPHGLGAAHALLGKTGHNTYLETAYEAGMGGLALWLGFVGLTSWRAWRQRHIPERRAWLQMWIAMLVMMAFFSLLYHSSFWVIAGVILSSRE